MRLLLKRLSNSKSWQTCQPEGFLRVKWALERLYES